MNYSVNSAVFLLIISSWLQCVASQSSPLWDGCSTYDVRPSTTLQASWDDHPATTQSACQDACTASPACGSYTFYTSWCRLHPISIRLIEEHNLPESILASDWYDMVGSKTCPPYVSTAGCSNYPVYHNRTYIKPAWTIASISATPNYELDMDHCKTYCSLFTACRSVAYWYDNTRAECHLYNTTVSQLQALDLYDDYGTDPFQGQLPVLITMDRYCAEEPYDPNTTTMTTTSQSVTPNPPDFCPPSHVHLSLLHGWYLCAAPGLLSVGECHQRNCCHVTSSTHPPLCVTNI